MKEVCTSGKLNIHLRIAANVVVGNFRGIVSLLQQYDSMKGDPFADKLFEMKLAEIYERHSWLKEEMPLKDFIRLFPITYKNNKPLKPDTPVGYDLDRNIFLEVLVAFRQSFT